MLNKILNVIIIMLIVLFCSLGTIEGYVMTGRIDINNGGTLLLIALIVGCVAYRKCNKGRRGKADGKRK